jgi:transposase
MRTARDHPARLPTTQRTDKSSPRQTAWLLIRQPPEAQAYLEELCRRSPEIDAIATAVRELFQMIQRRDAHARIQWLKTAKETPLRSFAAHLQRDQAAILAAMQLPWSNGHVEGQVHRLKLLTSSPP